MDTGYNKGNRVRSVLEPHRLSNCCYSSTLSPPTRLAHALNSPVGRLENYLLLLGRGPGWFSHCPVVLLLVVARGRRVNNLHAAFLAKVRVHLTWEITLDGQTPGCRGRCPAAVVAIKGDFWCCWACFFHGGGSVEWFLWTPHHFVGLFMESDIFGSKLKVCVCVSCHRLTPRPQA